MSYVTNGPDVGMIQISLRDLGMRNSDVEGLEKRVARFRNVTRATVSVDLWLSVQTNLHTFKAGEDLSSAMSRLETRIKAACHAAAMSQRV